MKGKPAKLVKSVTLRSLDGARDIDFGDSKYDARMSGDHSKSGSRMEPDGDYDDDKARSKRWGVGTF